MKKRYQNKKCNPLFLSSIIVMCCVVFLTVGFSTFSTELSISGISAIVKIQKDVRISGITLADTYNNGLSTFEDYNVKNVFMGVSLPNSDSTVTYDIEVLNLGNVEMAIASISGLPENLTYSISNYELKDKLCDDNNQSECKLGTKTTLHLTIGYKENGFNEDSIEYPLSLEFDFKRIFSITYKNIVNNNYPKTILESETKVITFVDDIPNNVSLSGVTSYNFESPILTISNPTDDVVINGSAYSRYYDELIFDGTNYVDTGVCLFNSENIDKNFIISFEISDVSDSQINLATIVNSMEEVSPYPGFVLRFQNNSNTQIEFNAPKIKTKTGIKISTLKKILLKRENDIYYIQINDGNLETLGTYNYDKTFDISVVLGGSPDTNPIRYFKGTLSNVNIEVYEPAKYTVKFDSNGGTGTMPDQVIRENETVNLATNLFEKEDYIFDGWNTEADGTGIQYEDGQAVTNLLSPNETITLYAIWTQTITYNIRYNANGGDGTMNMQDFIYGETKNIESNGFTYENFIFRKWNTLPDGTGTDYLPGQSVKNLTKTENDIIELYAIWSIQSFESNDEYVFDGTNYIDTGIYLFSGELVNKDFEVSFEIVSRATTTQYATLMSCMDETGSPWPGIVYRIKNISNDQFGANTNGSIKVENDYANSEITKVSLKRASKILYIAFNDGDYERVLDMTKLTQTFDVPLTFGASLNGSGNPQRYFKGTLKNMKVVIQK